MSSYPTTMMSPRDRKGRSWTAAPSARPVAIFSYKRLPWITVAVAVAALAIPFVPGAVFGLQFDRLALDEGELWRLLTAHLTHFGADHLQWDVAVWLGLGVLCEFDSRRALVQTLLTGALAISLAVWWWQPQFATFRGLSGLDSALLGLLAGRHLRRSRRERDRFMTVLCLAGIAGTVVKCIYELGTAQTVFVDTAGEFTPVPLAHAIGLSIGLAIASCSYRRLASEKSIEH